MKLLQIKDEHGRIPGKVILGHLNWCACVLACNINVDLFPDADKWVGIFTSPFQYCVSDVP
jgi:hypothetical protein